MKGILYLILAYLAGEGISILIGGLIPGSVMGMVLLFTSLKAGIIKPEGIKSAAKFLLDNMMLFFVPVSVGLIVSYELIGRHALGITSILVITTAIVLVAVGLIQQLTGGRKDD